jgi:predicted metal-binding protein
MQTYEKEEIMKLGIIRCMQTEDYCPGTADFRVVKEKRDAFQEVEGDIEIIGFTNCGGCPGKKAVLRARELVRRGADTIAFASCIQKGNPIGYPCPYAKIMKSLLKDDLPDQIKYIDYTHY